MKCVCIKAAKTLKLLNYQYKYTKNIYSVHSMQMRYYREIYTDDVINEEVRQIITRLDNMSTATWYGRVMRPNGLAKTILQGTGGGSN